MLWFARPIAAATAVLMVATTGASSSANTFGGVHNCGITLDSPHPSNGVIKAHVRIKCRQPVLSAHVENQLWRLRWWGWEAVGKPGRFTNPNPGKFFDDHSEWEPDGGCYYYRNTGSGWILLPDGTHIDSPGEGVNYDIRMKKGQPPGCGANWTTRRRR